MAIDVTAPGHVQSRGNAHILTKAIRNIERIFHGLGFEVVSGPWVETEFYNFDALNVPKNHPARDMQDTFWIKGLKETVLRTHTSGVQVRYMEKHQPPFRILVPGRVFRNEATDATHEAEFHQFEGLVVGENISLANLKFLLTHVIREVLEDDSIDVRFRPGYFPFVEPGVEVDLTCFKCEKGNPSETCNICKGSGWIELLGAGMVHPNVLKNSGIDHAKYQGLAFGPGIERLLMLKHGIDDIRDFLSADIPFIKQF